MSLNKFNGFRKAINIETKKNKTDIANADGRRKIPVRKKKYPNLSLMNSFIGDMFFKVFLIMLG